MLKVEILLSLCIFISWTVLKEVTSEGKLVKLRDRAKRDVDILADCGDKCLSKDQIKDYDVLLEYDYEDDGHNESNKHKPGASKQPCIYACKILDLNKTGESAFSPLKVSKNRTSNYEVVGFSSFETSYDKNAQNITVTFSPAIKHSVPTKAPTETSPATVELETSSITVNLKVAEVPTSPCLCFNNTSLLRNETTQKSTLVEDGIKENTFNILSKPTQQTTPVNQSHFFQTITNFTTESKEQNFYASTTNTPLLSVVPVIPKIIRLSVLEAEMVKAEAASHPSFKKDPGVSDIDYKTKNISWPETYSEKTISTFNAEIMNKLNENQELNNILNYQNTDNEQEKDLLFKLKDLLPKIKSKLTSSSTESTPIVTITSPNTRQSSFTSLSITLPTSKPGQDGTSSVESTELFTALNDISKKYPNIVTSLSLRPELTPSLTSSNQNRQTISSAFEPTVSTNLNDETVLSSVVSQTVKLSTERSTPELPGVTGTASLNKPVHMNPSLVMTPKPESFIKQNASITTTSPNLRSSRKLDFESAVTSQQGLSSTQTESGSTYFKIHENSSKLWTVSTVPNGLSDYDSTTSLSTLPAIPNAVTDVGSTLTKLQTSSLELDSGPTMTLEPAKLSELSGSEIKSSTVHTNMSKLINFASLLSAISTRLSESDPVSTLSTFIASPSINGSEFTLSTIPVSLSKQADLVSTFSVLSTNSSDRDLTKQLNSSVSNNSRHTSSPIPEVLSENNSFRSILSTPSSSSGPNVSYSTLPTIPTNLSGLITSGSTMSTAKEVLSKLDSLTLSTMGAFTQQPSLKANFDPASISSKIPSNSTKPSDIASTLNLNGSTDFATSSTTLSEVNHLHIVSSTPKMDMTTSAATSEILQNLTDFMSEHKIVSESLYEKSFSNNNSTNPMFAGQTTSPIRLNFTTISPSFTDTPLLNSSNTHTNDTAKSNETKLNSSINLKNLGTTFHNYFETISPFESLENFSKNMSTINKDDTLLA